jgi:hypothetical protein
MSHRRRAPVTRFLPCRRYGSEYRRRWCLFSNLRRLSITSVNGTDWRGSDFAPETSCRNPVFQRLFFQSRSRPAIDQRVVRSPDERPLRSVNNGYLLVVGRISRLPLPCPRTTRDTDARPRKHHHVRSTAGPRCKNTGGCQPRKKRFILPSAHDASDRCPAGCAVALRVVCACQTRCSQMCDAALAGVATQGTLPPAPRSGAATAGA